MVLVLWTATVLECEPWRSTEGYWDTLLALPAPLTVPTTADFSRRAAELWAAIESKIDTGDKGTGPATAEVDDGDEAAVWVARGAGRAPPKQNTVVDEGDADAPE